MSGLLPEPSRQYKFTVADAETNFVATEDKKSQKLKIRGATLLKLVEKLTSDDCLRIHPDFQQAVLVTLPTYASPNFFFDMLVERYNVPGADDVGASTHKDTFVPVQLRVLKLLKFWIDNFYHDFFVNDVTLRDKVYAFLDERATEDYMEAHVDALRRNLKEAEGLLRFGVIPKDKQWPLVSSFEADVDKTDPHTVSLAQFGAVDVARQIALRMHELAREVEWHQLNKHALEAVNSLFGSATEADPLALHASPPTKHSPALPNQVVNYGEGYWKLRQYVEDETLVCVHAAADGVTNSDQVIARQHALIDLFCDVATELLHMRCLTAAFAIAAVLLGKLSKKNLKAAWKGVPKRKESGLQAIVSLANPKKNYKELRQLKTSGGDKTPFTAWPPAVAAWLYDIHTSGPDFMPGGLGDLIDMEKRARMAEVLLAIRKQQHTPYPFVKSPFLQKYLVLSNTQRRHADASSAAGESDGGGGGGKAGKAGKGKASNKSGESTPVPGSPALERASTLAAAETPTKRNSKLGGLVRSFTKRRDSSADAAFSAAAAASAAEEDEQASGSSGSGRARRRSGSLVGTLKRKNKAKAASALKALSDAAADDSSHDDGSHDSDSEDDLDEDEQDDVRLSPRVRRLRALVRERATAEAAANEAAKQGLNAAFEATDGDHSALKKSLLTAVKRSAAARRLVVELLSKIECDKLVWSRVPPLMRDETVQIHASNTRAREALDLARSQASHLSGYLVKPTRIARADTNSGGSPPASPRTRSRSGSGNQAPPSPLISSSPPRTATKFIFPSDGFKRGIARPRTDSMSLRANASRSHSGGLNDAPRRRASLGNHRGGAAESQAAAVAAVDAAIEESHDDADATDAPSQDAATDSAAAADASAAEAPPPMTPRMLPAPLSYSSASVSLHSTSSSASNSPRSDATHLWATGTTSGGLPVLDSALRDVLRCLVPGRVMRAATLADDEGAVCGWPSECRIALLDSATASATDASGADNDKAAAAADGDGAGDGAEKADAEAKSEAAAATADVDSEAAAPTTVTSARSANALRVVADGMRLDVGSTPLPLLVASSIDEAELAHFVRQCRLHSSVWQKQHAEQASGDNGEAAESKIAGLLAVQLIDDALKDRAVQCGIFVVMH